MVSLADVEAARRRIAGAVVETPCLASEYFSECCGARVWLKFETLQRTGSFKPRGALNRLLSMSEAERARGVVAASAGNHAQGVAFAAARVGARSLIVMPEATPLIKISRTRQRGSEVELHGDTLDDAVRRAVARGDERGMTFVHPYDDPEVIAGQGTIALELLEQVPDLEAVVVPIGGGGLISGIATALEELRPEVEVYGVQSEAAPSMRESFAAGRLTAAEVAPSIAEGITVKSPCERTFEIIRRRVDGVELVSEAEIEDAVYQLLENGKTLTEGAGAAGVAALLHRRFPRLAGKTVAVVLCGANIDLNILARIIERSLVRQSRMVRLRIAMKDRPGALARLLGDIAEQEANVLRIHHNRTFTRTAFWEVEVDVTLETRDREHIEALLAALRAAGHTGVEEIGVRLVPTPFAP